MAKTEKEHGNGILVTFLILQQSVQRCKLYW